MNFIGNLFWLIFGGLLVALIYCLVGLLFCITIIGIPFGIQLFKLGAFALWPFGYDVTTSGDGMGCLSIFMNVLWILIGWWEIALIHISCGLILCITIIGIPLGIQHFKLAILGILPFGRTIVKC